MTGVHLGHNYDILKCSNRFSSLHYLVNVPFRNSYHQSISAISKHK